MMPKILALSFALVLAVPALASSPSDACREGAAYCHVAYTQLEACERANPEAPDACEAERAEATRQCMETTSACHTDGSRAKPEAQ